MTGIVYKKVASQTPVVDYLSQKINARLANNSSVLWLVAGGSALDIAVHVAKNLQPTPNPHLLTITLTDERYGATGHADSNWQQLIDRQFSLPKAILLPVLTGKGFKETAADYADMLDKQERAAGFSIALAGMGPDGHIFGIKPGSPSVGSHDLVSAYEWDDYQRLTPTISFIKRLDEVVVYAVGTEKHDQFKLLDKAIDPDKQPAQLLKKLQKVIIFNDFKGEAI